MTTKEKDRAIQYKTYFSSFACILLFFLGGASLETSFGGLFAPFILALTPGILFKYSNIKIHKTLIVSYTFFALSIILSCLMITSNGGSLRNIGGGIIVIGFSLLGLCLGSIFPILNKRVIFWGAIGLFLQILLSFLIALTTENIPILEVFSHIQQGLIYYYGLKTKIISTFGSSNYLGAFMLFFFGYSIYTLDVLLIVISCFGLAMTLSRTAILIASIAAVLTLVIRLIGRKRKKTFLGTTLYTLNLSFLAFLGAVLLYSSPQILDAIESNRSNITTASNRTELWQIGTEILQSNPFLGNGYGVLLELNSGVEQWSFHNGILDYWVSYGFFAAVSVLVYIFFILKLLYITQKRGATDQEKSKVYIGTILGISLMLIHSMFEPLLLDAKFILFCSLIGSSVSSDKTKI